MSNKTPEIKMRVIAVLAAAFLLFLAGCASNTGQPTPSSQHLTVSVTPTNATVQTGGVQQFTATVSPGSANQAVTWSVSGTGCSGATCGTIDENGKYTAPSSVPSPSTITAFATSVADATKTGAAAVGIVTTASGPSPSVNTVSPKAAPSGGPAFTLTVGGASFVSGSVVRWNDSDRPTTFVNSTLVTAQIPASDLATSGIVDIKVFNPPPAGGSSKSISFTVGGLSPISVAVAADASGQFGKFVYVANDLSDNVSMYSIDASTGRLALLGEVESETYTASVAVHPSGKFVYVANYGDHLAGISGSVSMFAINHDGSLAPLGVIAEGVGTTAMAVHPSGKFAYVVMARFNNAISTFSIDAASGALMSAQTIAGAAEGSTAVAVHPSGKFAYTANGAVLVGVPGSSNTISIYAVDGASGALTLRGTTAAGTLPSSVTVDPSGKFAYATNVDSDNVSMYSIDATTGLLTSVGTIGAGRSPSSVAVDPTGKFAYVANTRSNNVSMYTIAATTGLLTLAGEIDAGQGPSSVAIDPSGKFAYVANADSNNVSMYSINAATGALTLIGTIGT